MSDSLVAIELAGAVASLPSVELRPGAISAALATVRQEMPIARRPTGQPRALKVERVVALMARPIGAIGRARIRKRSIPAFEPRVKASWHCLRSVVSVLTL